MDTHIHIRISKIHSYSHAGFGGARAKSQSHVSTCMYLSAHGGDQTYKIFGSPDLPDVRVDLLSDGDSVYSRENLFEILRTPEKMCFICSGTPVKTC